MKPDIASVNWTFSKTDHFNELVTYEFHYTRDSVYTYVLDNIDMTSALMSPLYIMPI